MGSLRRGRNERQEIKRITDEYLESIRHKITPRDMEILKLLDQHPLLSSSHLLELCPGAGNQQPFHMLAKGQQRLNDRLRVLFDLNLIHKYAPPLAPGEGTSKQYVWLDRGGAKLIGTRRRTTAKLPANYLHTHCVMELYVELRRLARIKHLDLFVSHIEQPLSTLAIVPDLVVLYRRQGFGYLYIIEVDRCEKKEADEIAKIKAYRDWQISGLWLREGWARILPTPKFPHVLYLFDPVRPSWKKRQTAFRRSAEEARLPFKSLTLQEFIAGLSLASP